MIIYGVNPILEAIRSHPERIRYVGVAREETARHQRLMGEAKRAGVAVRNLALDQIDRLAGRGVHNGVVAEVSETAYADFDEIIEKEETNFVLILDSITDPQNFGAILRVADGFGVDLVVIPEHDSVGLTPVAVKASAGASEWVQVAQVTNLSRTIETLKKAGYWIYAAAENGERPDAIDFTRQGRARRRQRGERNPAQRARALRPHRHDPDERPRRVVQCGDGGGGALLRSSAATADDDERSGTDQRKIPQMRR